MWNLYVNAMADILEIVILGFKINPRYAPDPIFTSRNIITWKDVNYESDDCEFE